MKKPTSLRAKKEPRPAKPAPKNRPQAPRAATAENKEAACAAFPYVEPRWPGSPPTWPAPAPLAEVVDLARRFLDTATHADNRGAKGNSPALCAAAAMRLVEWLAATAASGDTDEARAAQAEIFNLARQTTAQLNRGFRKGWPLAIETAQKSTDVPGFVSRNPTINQNAQHLLMKIGQGQDVPGVVRQPGKKSPRVIDSPAQTLVACLRDYMGELRAPWRKAFPPEWIACAAPQVLEILALPPLSAPRAWKRWEAVAWEILVDFSPRRDPANLAALQSTPLRPLLKAGTPLRDAHRKAWKALAK